MPSVPSYKDAKLPAQQRAKDLLSRMTLEEKVGQMLQLDGRSKAEENYDRMHPGSFLHVLGQQATELQQRARESRLGIPLLFGIDAIHGHSFWPGATIFPTQLGLASSWNPGLLERVGRVTALEMSHTGVHWTFSPVFCLTRDLRWGRVGETFGEDPHVIGTLGAAMVRGYQGEDISHRRSILACAKHFAGYSDTQGGRDSSEADISRRRLRSLFLPPFKHAVDNGCATLMTAYQAIDGVPCTASRWLLNEVLREEWGFEGLVVTDWRNVAEMVNGQRVCATYEEAAAKAVVAGNDLIMATPEFYKAALTAAKSGALPEKFIDRACRRILHTKFAMGLFEDNRVYDEQGAKVVPGCADHRDVALEAARESVVLLRNVAGILPLQPEKVRRIAVIGPNADNPIAQLGDWSLGTGQAGSGEHPRESVVSVLDGIRARVGGQCDVVHAPGGHLADSSSAGIEEAVGLAEDSDVAVVVVGDQQEYVGERRSTATLELMGGQKELLEAVYLSGTPMIAVLINSKPLAIPRLVRQARAIVEAWNPGMLGGAAVAEVLFGDINPCGKLTVSFPRHVGQQPVWYNQLPGQHGSSYADMTQDPLFPFGFGLSYTSFRYDHLSLESGKIKAGQNLHITVDVTNTGSRAGVETVQVYLSDLCTSATWPVKELRDFSRVPLEPGHTSIVSFDIPYDRLAIVNADGERVVEPGEFEVMVGPSSRDDGLLRQRFRVVS